VNYFCLKLVDGFKLANKDEENTMITTFVFFNYDKKIMF